MRLAFLLEYLMTAEMRSTNYDFISDKNVENSRRYEVFISLFFFYLVDKCFMD